ncbi:HD-GYP domain-containing protein (c-di-GMP phosphodiesterase class II) [Massilia sp. UYP11]|uniref:HD-GYP domain-containing protein n=1 Tax=Massilia sp. UYP11 TaxID=1756385 RepID=UPI003D24FCB0
MSRIVSLCRNRYLFGVEMLKTIDASELKLGMAIHDLDCGWMEHPFIRSRFVIRSDEEIKKIRRAGIRGVVIDCERGIDVSYAPPLAVTLAKTETQLQRVAEENQQLRPSQCSLTDEQGRAVHVKRQAIEVVRTVMKDARLGRAIEIDNVEFAVQRITDSVFRNQGALLGLLRIKNKDNYTFLHSVSVCTLMVAFCRSRGLADDVIVQAGIGGLLHDTGKALVPDNILNKGGRLTDEEFEIVKCHPRDGYHILKNSPDIGEIVLDITLHHHERRDGTGYPCKQREDDISELAQMAAIVDVYDAITSDRSYHKGICAAEALRKIYQWSEFHFNPILTQEFMRCVGIYPVRTLVLLESGRLGIVIESHESNLLTPKVRVFFNSKTRAYMPPATVDLSRPVGFGGGDKIVSFEKPEAWGIDVKRFM